MRNDFEKAYDLFKPRKATVVDTRPGEVRVRFWRDDAITLTWITSVFSSTPVDTNGVVIRVNRDEMLFVPEKFITSSPGSAAWGSISGVLSDQTDLATALNGKSNVGHNHDGVYSPVSHTHDWGAITGKPSTFPPSSHTHGVGDITASGTPGTTTYLRGDGSWVTPPNTNTTYSEITEAEISAGTASTLRTISGRRAQAIVNKAREGLALASSLALVATSGSYTDLSNRPTLGSLAAKSAVNVPADISATGTPGTTTYLRGDGTWATPPNTNTTYAEITSAEIETGTASTARAISGRRAQEIVNKARDGVALITSLGSLAAKDKAAIADIDASGFASDQNFLRGDGIWAAPPNTLYAEISEAEITAGTSSALRSISGRRAQAIVNKARTDLETTAQLNARDTANRNRANHTGTQLAATISDLAATVAAHTDVSANTSARHTHSNKAVLDAVTAAYTTGEKTKLAGIASGATANQTDAYLLNRGNHTGTQLASTISDFSATVASHSAVAANTSARHTHSNKSVLDDVTAAYTTAMNTKLSGIATGATANATDAYLLNRGNHTGNQAISTITNLQEILDGKPIEVDPGNYSTAIGVDAQAPGSSSFAAGHGAEASGNNSAAVGQAAEASGHGSTSVGMVSLASGNDSTALGHGAWATGLRASAFGSSAKAEADNSNAIGRNAVVPATSPRSQAFGQSAQVPPATPDTTLFSAKSVLVQPHPDADTLASTITLYDAAGNPHVIPATVGQTHSHSENTSPGGENLTGVGTYSTAGVLRSGTLQSYIPAITSGLWDVDIEAHALVYRSVATGGVYLFVGNGTTSYQQALGRLSPQTHAYTLNVNVSPSIVGGTALKAVTPSQIIDMRYTGFQTAGTTTVINHGWKITARRVG